MMNFTGKDLQDDFKRCFGKDISELTAAQVMWLIKFSKHVRGRCRSNAALRNYLSLNFTGHNFREVERDGTRGKYKTIEVSSKVTKETAVDNDDE